ncbi:MAG: hypothetical protein CL759_07105 [Chloroflexi bacterium]|nr:hypothetical protein [Chloroflexota bacterium]
MPLLLVGMEKASMNRGSARLAKVADSGTGISSEDLLRVFDRFFRADASRSRATGGVGLGLTIAKQLVEAHGGSIHVESVVPNGARFAFEIPIAGPGEQGQ